MRYKEYNVNRVLEKSMLAFWKKGFNGCSIRELVDLTGVNRFSLYHEFENKDGILYHTLNLYRSRYCDENLILLENKGDLKTVLKQFYLSFLSDDRPRPGCYFIHIGTELADTDERVKEKMNDYLSEIRSRFIHLLCEHGMGTGESEFLAKHLVGLYITAMSFCLIQTEKDREAYISNGIYLIIAKNGTSIK